MVYTITVNQDHINLSKDNDSAVIVTDDLSSLFTLNGQPVTDYQVSLSRCSVTKEGDAYMSGADFQCTASQPTSKKATLSDHVLYVNLGTDPGYDSYVITLYVQIGASVFSDDFGDYFLITSNTASVSGGMIVGNPSVTTKEDTNNKIPNKLVSKSAGNLNTNTGELPWTLKINPREASLSGDLIIKDYIPTSVNARFDTESVQIFTSKHTATGADNGTDTELDTSKYTVEGTVSEDGFQYLVITIKSPATDAYTVRYNTIITGTIDSLTNHASVIVEGEEKSQTSDTGSAGFRHLCDWRKWHLYDIRLFYHE